MVRKFIPYIGTILLFFGVAAGVGWGQSVTLISPNTTGLTWSGAEEIEWSTSTTGWAPGDTVLLELSSDGGVAYDTVIARNLPYDLENFRFHTTTLANSASYRVKITRNGGGASDESGYNFAISNPIPIPGTAYYVNDASTTNDVYCTAVGNDTNDGLSPATPRLTLQTVIDDDSLGEGDVVFIDTGEWIRVATEAALTVSDQGSALSPIYFAGSPNGTVFSGNFQPGSAERININDSAYLTFSNLSLESSLQEGIYGIDANNVKIVASSVKNNSWGVRTSRSSRISLIDNLLQNNKAGAVLLSSGSHHLVDGNTITGNTSEGSYTIFLDAISYSRIINNTIQNNSGSGILHTRGNNNSIQYNLIRNSVSRNLMIDRSSYIDASHNLLLTPGSYNIFLNQTSRTSVFNNFLYGSGFYIGTQDLNLLVANNIIWSFQPSTYCIYGVWKSAEEQGIVSDFNLLFPTGGAQAGYWEGNRTDLRSWILGSGQDGRSISENPLLVNFPGGDYHPQSTEGSYHNGAWTNDSNDSPALNAGMAVTAQTTLTSPVSAGGTSVQLVSAAGFLPGPGQVQIDDDIIYYAGISGNTLTGCAGILEDHLAGTEVFQPVGSAYDREPAANGDRVNIGPYGNMNQASKSSRKSLLITSPLGGPQGYEKWAREKDIDWQTIGSGWGALDTIAISYSSDSVDWTTITDGIAYNSQPYPNWNTLSVAESNTGRIRIIPSAGAATAFSGIFIVDNSPPTIGLFSPEDGATGIPLNTALISDIATDPGAGLHSDAPYYFRIDRAESFDSPHLQTSGWLPTRTWYVDLDPGTGYYWQVRSRDAADPSNVSDFFAETNLPGSYWKLRTSLVLQAADIESTTTGLRWMLDNYDLGPGDTIYVTPGTYLLSAPLSLTAGDEGDEEAGVTIEGLNGEVILDGNGLAANCLTVTGDY
ncbi:MAG: right-handed parallel beta-helix repeat-containing protein, partial [Candidatus Erginobacter occultus]|nr:right-handed parallel beta-helix repeat-containing protein [Candidatus Erginobacter occultus]